MSGTTRLEDDNSREYRRLMRLDELESLLEDLEDEQLTGLESTNIPHELKKRMESLGVRDVVQVREELVRLHAEVDDDLAELEITDS